jgi:catalase
VAGGAVWRSVAPFDAGQRERLCNDIGAAMQGVSTEIMARQVEHFRRAHPAYAEVWSTR